MSNPAPPPPTPIAAGADIVDRTWAKTPPPPAPGPSASAREWAALTEKWRGIIDSRLASIVRDLSAFARTCTAVDDGFAKELDAFNAARRVLSDTPALLRAAGGGGAGDSESFDGHNEGARTQGVDDTGMHGTCASRCRALPGRCQPEL